MDRNGGYAAIWRRLYDSQDPLHPKRTGHPVSIREAFTDLILRASYYERDGLDRGQFRASIRQLAERWNLPPARAQRYMEKLREMDRVRLVEEGTNRPSLYALPNYERWQPPFDTRGDTPNDTPNDTPSDPELPGLSYDRDTPNDTANDTRGDTPTLLYKKKKTDNGSSGGVKKRVVQECWEAWKELNADWWDVDQMRLTSKRRKKLEKLYDEQLKPRADEYPPLELFRAIITTAREHEFWGSKRSLVKPETLFRSTEKREERTLEALDSPDRGRRGPQRPSDRTLGRNRT